MSGGFDTEALSPLAVGFAAAVKGNRAEHAAHEAISRLPAEDWIAQRRMPTGTGLEVDYLLLGPTGAFCLALAYEGWSPAIVEQLADGAERLRSFALDAYPDEIRCGVFLPMSEAEPRLWSFEGGAGWIVGRGQLERWLSFFNDRGFTPGEIARIRELSALALEHRPRPLGIPAPAHG